MKRDLGGCERREIARRRVEEERAEAPFLCERPRSRRIPRAIARAVLKRASAQLQSHQHTREPAGDRAGVSSLGEAGVLEQLAGSHVGHGEVDLLA